VRVPVRETDRTLGSRGTFAFACDPPFCAFVFALAFPEEEEWRGGRGTEVSFIFPFIFPFILVWTSLLFDLGREFDRALTLVPVLVFVLLVVFEFDLALALDRARAIALEVRSSPTTVLDADADDPDDPDSR